MWEIVLTEREMACIVKEPLLDSPVPQGTGKLQSFVESLGCAFEVAEVHGLDPK